MSGVTTTLELVVVGGSGRVKTVGRVKGGGWVESVDECCASVKGAHVVTSRARRLRAKMERRNTDCTKIILYLENCITLEATHLNIKLECVKNRK